MVARFGAFISSLTVAAGIHFRIERKHDLAKDVTGDSVTLTEEGFQRVFEMKSDKDMKSFVYRVLMSEARYVTDEGRFNGFVPFYSGTQAHLTHKGAAKCDSGESISERLCLEVGQRLLPTDAAQERTTLQVGSYGPVPVGCSVQSGGDWAVHYNKNPEGHNNGGYSLVCGDPQKHTLAELKKELRRVSWVADGLGRTAQLAEDGYRKVYQQRSIGHMRAYLRRLLESEHYKVTSDSSFDAFVRVYTSDAAAQKTLASLLEELKLATWVSPLSSWQGLSGTTAPISEDGYQMVAKLQSNDEMRSFVQRVLASEARTVQDEAGMNGILPFYSGVEAVQSLGALQAEIRDRSRSSSWVGLDIGRTAPLSEEGYLAAADRRSNVQMKEFIRRVASDKYMKIEPGAMNGLVPYHSGKISTQSFDKLVSDLDSLQSPAAAEVSSDASEE